MERLGIFSIVYPSFVMDTFITQRIMHFNKSSHRASLSNGSGIAELRFKLRKKKINSLRTDLRYNKVTKLSYFSGHGAVSLSLRGQARSTGL